MRPFALLIVAYVVCLPLGADSDEDKSGKAKPERRFRPRRVVPPFDPITDVRTLSAAAVKDEVTDGELVLGVVVGDEARAYPINMLTGPQREIINDVLGGYAIAATW